MICQGTKMLLVAENHEYNETDSVDSAQSSLKSHPLWITLYIQLSDFSQFFFNIFWYIKNINITGI